MQCWEVKQPFCSCEDKKHSVRKGEKEGSWDPLVSQSRCSAPCSRGAGGGGEEVKPHSVKPPSSFSVDAAERSPDQCTIISTAVV